MAEQENFDALRKLLAMKRREIPPPGYHEQFASEIRARLMAGEHRQPDLWRELGDEASWLQRLWATLAERPALASAFGMAVCGLMIAGITYYDHAQKSDADAAALAGLSALPTAGTAGSLTANTTQSALPTSSTNAMPVMPGGNSLFDQIGVPSQAAPVDFSPGASR